VTDPRVDHQPIREVRRSAGAAGREWGEREGEEPPRPRRR
jgi:hypothetical protein